MSAIKHIALTSPAKQSKTEDCAQIAGVTSAAPAGLGGVIRDGASVKVYPTTAGTALVKTSCSPANDAMADISANNFTTGKAHWDNWDNGSVTAASIAALAGTVTAVAIIVTSGTWNLEIAQ